MVNETIKYDALCTKHILFSFQLNLPDVKIIALEGDKHTAVLQVLYDTERFNFLLITII
jgi:hypothetical protein